MIRSFEVDGRRDARRGQRDQGRGRSRSRPRPRRRSSAATRDAILRDVLGYDDERIDAGRARGVRRRRRRNTEQRGKEGRDDDDQDRGRADEDRRGRSARRTSQQAVDVRPAAPRRRARGSSACPRPSPDRGPRRSTTTRCAELAAGGARPRRPRDRRHDRGGRRPSRAAITTSSLLLRARRRGRALPADDAEGPVDLRGRQVLGLRVHRRRRAPGLPTVGDARSACSSAARSTCPSSLARSPCRAPRSSSCRPGCGRWRSGTRGACSPGPARSRTSPTRRRARTSSGTRTRTPASR